MRLDAYTRALAQVREAVMETYWTETGTVIPEDLALAVGLAAVTTFLNAAKADPVAVGAAEPFRPDPRAASQIHAGG